MAPDDDAMWSLIAPWSFSQTRGTAKKIVGRQARRSSAAVDRLRANQVSPPDTIWPKWLTMRSAMCESGRNDRNRSSGPIGTMAVIASIVARRLPCESMAPFGAPVVPLV